MVQPLVELYGGCMVVLKVSRCRMRCRKLREARTSRAACLVARGVMVGKPVRGWRSHFPDSIQLHMEDPYRDRTWQRAVAGGPRRDRPSPVAVIQAPVPALARAELEQASHAVSRGRRRSRVDSPPFVHPGLRPPRPVPARPVLRRGPQSPPCIHEPGPWPRGGL
jgi:hypothetical protein